MSWLDRTLAREVRALGLTATGAPGPVVGEHELAPLPEPARRYLRFMRVPGRPRDTTFRARLRGRFRPRRDSAWLDADIRQFSSGPDVARVFHMTLRMFGVPVYGRDTYVAGRGRMRIRPLDLFTIQDSDGPSFDQGELVTWLNDAVLLAPSMLLSPAIRFSVAGDDAFDLAVEDHGTVARARVLVAPDGAVTEFSTEDRSYDTGPRTRWTTPVSGWQLVDGRRLPTGGRAVWHFPEGEHCYAEVRFEPGDLAFGVAPGA